MMKQLCATCHYHSHAHITTRLPTLKRMSLEGSTYNNELWINHCSCSDCYYSKLTPCLTVLGRAAWLCDFWLVELELGRICMIHICHCHIYSSAAAGRLSLSYEHVLHPSPCLTSRVSSLGPSLWVPQFASDFLRCGLWLRRHEGSGVSPLSWSLVLLAVPLLEGTGRGGKGREGKRISFWGASREEKTSFLSKMDASLSVLYL